MSEQSRSGSAAPADTAPADGDAGGPAAPIDGAVVESLRVLGARSGRDVLGELTVLYLSTADAQVETARTLLDAGDLGELARVAHALKGSSSVIGARCAAVAAAELEDSTNGAQASDWAAEQALRRFVSELERFRAAVPGLRTPG